MSLDKNKTINLINPKTTNIEKKKIDKDSKESLEIFVETMKSMKVVLTQIGADC